MKKIISTLLASLFLFGAGAVHAQEALAGKPDAPTVRAVQDLMEAQKMHLTLQAMFTQTAQQMEELFPKLVKQALQGKPGLTDSQRQKLQAAMAPMLRQLSATVKETFTDPGLVDEVILASVPLYLSHFSMTEIEQITAFYRSPAGAKLVNEAPKLMQEMMPLSERIMMPRVLKMQQQLEQQLDQLKIDIEQKK